MHADWQKLLKIKQSAAKAKSYALNCGHKDRADVKAKEIEALEKKARLLVCLMRQQLQCCQKSELELAEAHRLAAAKALTDAMGHLGQMGHNHERMKEAQNLGASLSAPAVEEAKAEEKAEEQKVKEKLADEPKVEEKLAEEQKVEEKPADKPKVEEKAEEPKVEEKPADEPKVEEKLAEEPKVEEKPADEPKVEEKLAEEQKVEEKLADEPKVEEITADMDEATLAEFERPDECNPPGSQEFWHCPPSKNFIATPEPGLTFRQFMHRVDVMRAKKPPNKKRKLIEQSFPYKGDDLMECPQGPCVMKGPLGISHAVPKVDLFPVDVVLRDTPAVMVLQDAAAPLSPRYAAYLDGLLYETMPPSPTEYDMQVEHNLNKVLGVYPDATCFQFENGQSGHRMSFEIPGRPLDELSACLVNSVESKLFSDGEDDDMPPHLVGIKTPDTEEILNSSSESSDS